MVVQQKRERKLTGLNTLPAVRKTKGLSKSREELAGYGLPQPRRRQEAGGRGKGQAQPQGLHPLPHCKQTSSFLPKTSEILDGQHPPGAL